MDAFFFSPKIKEWPDIFMNLDFFNEKKFHQVVNDFYRLRGRYGKVSEIFLLDNPLYLEMIPYLEKMLKYFFKTEYAYYLQICDILRDFLFELSGCDLLPDKVAYLDDVNEFFVKFFDNLLRYSRKEPCLGPLAKYIRENPYMGRRIADNWRLSAALRMLSRNRRGNIQNRNIANIIRQYSEKSAVFMNIADYETTTFSYQSGIHRQNFMDDLIPSKSNPYNDLSKHQNLCALSLFTHHVLYNPRQLFALKKPVFLNYNASGELHSDGYAAVEYPGNYKLWLLNGILVSKEISETPAEKLDPVLALTERNVDVRREIIRKVGMERMVKELGAKSVDKRGNYELINFDIIDGEYRPFLKMSNPSIDAIHVEGVDPRCRTVEQALAWRDGEDVYRKPDILT